MTQEKAILRSHDTWNVLAMSCYFHKIGLNKRISTQCPQFMVFKNYAKAVLFIHCDTVNNIDIL